jgi:hypothetical protein
LANDAIGVERAAVGWQLAAFFQDQDPPRGSRQLPGRGRAAGP